MVSIGIFKRTKKRGGTNLVNSLGLVLNLNYNFLLYPPVEQFFVCVFLNPVSYLNLIDNLMKSFDPFPRKMYMFMFS